MYPMNNYNYFQPQYQQTILLKGRPVSSIEEVKAAQVDFDGSVFYFPDVANKRIYTKQVNLDGTSSLLMYSLTEIPVEKPSTNEYITRKEFEDVIQSLKPKTTKKEAKVNELSD